MENRLVHVVVESVVARSVQFQPLVLVGPNGVGKSHLIHALTRQWKQLHPSRKTLITTGADFARAYAAAVDADGVADWREKYSGLDLLIVDDLEQLAHKSSAQHELVVTIDRLVALERLVIVSLRRLPRACGVLTSRLVSRLSAGLVVPLAAPGLEARREILRRLNDAHELNASDEVTQLLAERLVGVVPELNNAVLQLKVSTRDVGEPLDRPAVAAYLAERQTTRQPALRTITTRVSKHFQLKSADLKSSSRRQPVARARGVAMYLARKLTSKSYEQLGRHFGGRDHSTVMHACRKTESLVRDDPTMRHTIDELIAQLTH